MMHRKTIWLGVALMVLTVALGSLALWPFETLSKLAVIAAFLRGALIVLLAWAVFGHNKVDYISRACLGLSAVAMTMTVQSLLIEKTPYEIWAAILSTAGFLGFFVRMFGFGMWHRIAKMAGDEE
jgi:hypothetical protein